jgi:uncharacterized protein (TIGR00255 family)
MTGFGRHVVEEDGLQLEVEIRSVNHRYLDASYKLPFGYNAFELSLNKHLKNTVRRGRVEVNVVRKDQRSKAEAPKCDYDLLEAYLGVVRDSADSLGLNADELVRDAASNAMCRREFIDLSASEETSVEGEFPLLEIAFSAALDELVEMRRVEGQALEQDLLSHLSALDELVLQMESAGSDTAQTYRDRLSARLQRLEPNLEIEPQRLAQEVALIADRTDFSEEVARLKSHGQQFRQILASGGGRKLDFVVQEMMREVNTVGSKAQNADVSAHVVEAKTVIEKLREQVQNIE